MKKETEQFNPKFIEWFYKNYWQINNNNLWESVFYQGVEVTLKELKELYLKENTL